MELQALRYGAMVSAMTFEKAVDVYARHLARRRQPADARAGILAFLGWQEPDDNSFAQDVRIVLVSADFHPEISTTRAVAQPARARSALCAPAALQARRPHLDRRAADHPAPRGRAISNQDPPEGRCRSNRPRERPPQVGRAYLHGRSREIPWRRDSPGREADPRLVQHANHLYLVGRREDDGVVRSRVRHRRPEVSVLRGVDKRHGRNLLLLARLQTGRCRRGPSSGTPQSARRDPGRRDPSGGDLQATQLRHEAPRPNNNLQQFFSASWALRQVDFEPQSETTDESSGWKARCACGSLPS